MIVSSLTSTGDAGPRGVLGSNLNLPGQILPGVPHYFQLRYRDPTGGSAGFNATGARYVTFAP